MNRDVDACVDGFAPSCPSLHSSRADRSAKMIRFSPALLALLLGTASLVSGGVVQAEPVAQSDIKNRTEAVPKRAVGVDVEEHLGSSVPRALSFLDEGGQPVLYDEVVRGFRGGEAGADLPTILTMNYSDCPMLCSLQLNALVEGIGRMDGLTLGKDYRIVTVSLDPNETPETLGKLKRRYLAQYGRPEVEPSAWTILSGSEQNVRAVARALGIEYNYNEARDEYVHPAVVVMTTPKGQISRYLYGLEYHPKTLALSLVEASEGKVGSSIDRLILYCFHYDASEGRYAPVAMNIMRVVGGGFALALFALLGVLWLGERKKRTRAASSNQSLAAAASEPPIHPLVETTSPMSHPVHES